MQQLVGFGKRFIAQFTSDDIPGIAAEAAYRFLFAVFPFGIFVAALSAFAASAIGIEDPAQQMLDALGDNLPGPVATELKPQLETVIGRRNPGLLTFGALAALWAATGGTNTLIKAMNRAFDVEETRPWLRKTLTAVGMTLLASIGILAAFVTIVGTSVLSDEAAQRLGLDGTALTVMQILRWPIVFLFLVGAVGLLFRLAPAIRPPWRWCFAGGAVFAFGWLAATGLFALYVTNFSNYSNTYGALGGVIVLLLWFYLTALVLLVAVEIMAVALRELVPHQVDVTPHEAPVDAEVDRKRTKEAAASAEKVLEGYRRRRAALRDATPAAVAADALPTSSPLVPRLPGDTRLAGGGAPTEAPVAISPVAELRRAVRVARPGTPGTARPTSDKGEWLGAGLVTGAGLALGAAAAWLLGRATADDDA